MSSFSREAIINRNKRNKWITGGWDGFGWLGGFGRLVIMSCPVISIGNGRANDSIVIREKVISSSVLLLASSSPSPFSFSWFFISFSLDFIMFLMTWIIRHSIGFFFYHSLFTFEFFSTVFLVEFLVLVFSLSF